MTPRILLTSKGILFLVGEDLGGESRQHQVFPDSRAKCNTQGEEPAAPSLLQQRQPQFQTEGGGCLGLHFPSRCTCQYLLGGPTWDIKTHRVPALKCIIELTLDRQPGQKMRFQT